MLTATKYWFIEEVAADFRVPISTVRHWIATGKLRSVRPGRRRLIRDDDLKRFGEQFAPALTEDAQG